MKLIRVRIGEPAVEVIAWLTPRPGEQVVDRAGKTWKDLDWGKK